MGIFVRAVISGFGFSLGAALFKKLSRTVGFEEGAGNGDTTKRGDRTGPDEPRDESRDETAAEISDERGLPGGVQDA